MGAQGTLYRSSELEEGCGKHKARGRCDVALAVLHYRSQDRILLIRRSSATDLTGWAFPGGKIEEVDFAGRKESAAVTAARRELAEETGFVVKGLGHEIYARKHPKTGVVIKYVYFACDDPVRPTGTNPEESTKVDDVAWVRLADLEKIFDGNFSQVVLSKIQSLNSRMSGRPLNETMSFHGQLDLDLSEKK